MCGLVNTVGLGKRKLSLLTRLVTDLKDECDLHNFYLARLTREVKREINIRNAARRDARGRGLHLSTSRLNLSVFCGTRVHFGVVQGLFGRCHGVLRSIRGYSGCILHHRRLRLS